MGIGLKVPVKDAEEVKKKLLSTGAFYKGRKVKHHKNFVVFPLRRRIYLGDEYQIVEEDFPKVGRKSFKEYLQEFLDSEELRKVHRSFDIIGDLAIIEVPDELWIHEKRIAESLAKAHKNIQGVYKKAGAVKGGLRTRKLKHLWGRKDTVTLHREHGCLFRVDIAGVYFSPRLAYERQRILRQVRDEEVIVDFFAGVGPFSILLAKNRDVKVYAIDSNPRAYELLKENILLNKVVDKVIALLGDCRQVAPAEADRAIMNLPLHSHKYLDLAFDVVKDGVIHFYTVSPEEDLFTSKEEFVMEVAEEKNRKATILNRKVVRPYAPRRHHIVLDVSVED